MGADEELRQKLVAETSRIAWKELQVFFAQGKTVQVASPLDLIDVAIAISEDDSATVKAWMDDGRLAAVSDDQARQRYDNDILVWTVVVKPWVLVQNVKEAVEPV